MPPRRKSSHELKSVCARRGRIRARERQEAILLSRAGVKEFLDALRSEHATFSSRIVEGEPLPRMLDGTVFDWSRNHFLTQAKDCATEFLDDSRWTDWRPEFADFLERINEFPTGGEFIDPVAAATVEKLFQAFIPDGFVLWNATLFRLVDYFASKHSDGSYLFTDRDEVGFQNEIAPILDRANEAIRAVNLPHLR